MDCTRRNFVRGALGATGSVVLAGCARDNHAAPSSEASSEKNEQKQEQEKEQKKANLDEFKDLAVDMRSWKYDEENDVYYLLGLPYCLHPESASLESLAIFVPGAYLMESEEEKGAFVCNPEAQVGEFSAATAPIVMPLNAGTLRPQACPTSYSYAGLKTYLDAGLVYVYAGFRGRSSGYESSTGGVYAGGAPWPAVDLKAAVRFLRYNAAMLPGDPDRIFTFGFSAAGGVSALLGASGDSELFAPYLEQIGAATHDAQGDLLSDAVHGSASWCPVTSFGMADASYEWMMGQYSQEGSRAEGVWTQALSRDLAEAYATYVNDLGLKDREGGELRLDETSGELFADGSYYNYLVDLVQESATSFFSTTQFPYTHTPHYLVNANFPGDPDLQSAGAGASDVEALTGDASAQAAGMVVSEGLPEGMARVQSVVYASVSDYVNDLNTDFWWFTYNQRNASVRVAGLGEFVRRLRPPVKDVCAFDALDRSTVQNQLFGVEDESSLHFSSLIARLLAEKRDDYAELELMDETFVDEWESDLAVLDAFENSIETRVSQFDPLYYLCEGFAGFGTAKTAPRWRIRAGLFQTDTSLCTEVNLALALNRCEDVEQVDFAEVWGQGHTLAETTGSAEENLVAWVLSCCKE